MNPYVLGSLITGGANVLGGLFGMGSQASANKANLELAKYQNEWNLKMWNMQNEYNTPKNQMARYLDAGLNPNLIYGSGSSSAGNSTSVPTAANMHVEPLPVPNLGEAAQQLISNIRADRLADADIKAKEADVRNKDSLSQYNDAKRRNEDLQSFLLDLDRINKQIKNETDSENLEVLKAVRDERIRSYSLANEAQGLENSYNSRTLDTRVQNTEQFLKNTKATYNEIKSRTNLNNANARLAAAKINEVAANIVLINRKSHGQLIDNSLKEATFNDEISKVSQELTNLVLSGNEHAIENFMKVYGLDKGYLMRELRGVIGTFVTGATGHTEYDFGYRNVRTIHNGSN